MDSLRQFSKVNHLLLLFVFLFGGTTRPQTLQNSCTFNQFRCSDGSACLLSEKLCNGIEDCPSGEDENGSSQWDCSLTTLSTACSSDEFRCRFGGCIPKSQQCDGMVSYVAEDCWGATDESTDLCFKRPSKRPSPQPFTTSQRPIKITTTSKTTASYISTQRVTTETLVQQISTSTERESDRIIWSSSCNILIPPNGAEVVCRLNNRPVPCTTAISQEGTAAQYRCQKYWDSPKIGSKTARQVCRNGQWTQLNKNWKCSLQCGEGGISATGFIVSGYDSNVGRWPWHVGLFQENPPNSGKFEFFCGGSLISKRSILTAAHCITESQTSKKRTDRILALLGKYNRTFNNDDAFVQEREVVDIEFPEYYTPKFYEQDIAIIWLDKNAEINERVRPVCLPSDEDELKPTTPGTLAGWGRWEDRSYPEKLQMAQLPVVPVNECRKTHASLAALSRSTTFCAGYKNGTSACDGDSGGGLVFVENNRYYVQGIVSAGINSYGQGGGCDPKFYTIFTKVSKFRLWIDRLLDIKDSGRNL